MKILSKLKIPPLIVVGLLIIIGGGYFGFVQYKNYQIQKIEQEKEAQALTEAQKKTLEETQLEIEKLKEESAESKKKQETLEQKIQSNQQKPIPQNITISAAELEPYLTGVGRIDCSSDWSSFDWSKISVGSGSLWNIQGIGYSVLTNKHVIDIPKGPYAYCRLKVADNGNIKAYKNAREIAPGLVTGGDWWLDEENVYRWNQKTDVALLKIRYEFVDGDLPDGLNYTIGSLRFCSQRMVLNSPVVAIGFPASTMKVVEGGAIQSTRTVTNGIISSHDESTIRDYGLPAPDYFISAKIDSGNSGGIVLSKDNNGLCVLGIPTWVNVGNFETQGIVQNIHNIMYSK